MTGLQSQDPRRCIRKTLHLTKNVQPILEVKLRRSKVTAEELQTYKDNTSDERHTARGSVLGGEVRLQVTYGLDVLLQGELLLGTHLGAGGVAMYTQLNDALLVGGAEGQQGVQDGWFAGAGLKDEGGPEAGGEGR
ncbi:hypothetical protein HG530_012158 [Fusarium avenaceum]|nr:hypothetical protein HG530_012158 [Fusarium avenaceum]